METCSRHAFTKGRTEPPAQILPDLVRWVADIRSVLDDKSWRILYEHNVEGQTLEQIGERMNRSRQRVDQIEARAVKRALEQAADSVTALLQWVESLDSSVFLAVDVSQSQAEYLAIAIGVANKLLGRRLHAHVFSNRLRVLTDKKRIEALAEIVRRESRTFLYAEVNEVAEVLGISSDEIRALTYLSPELLFFTRGDRLAFCNWTKGHQFEAIAHALAGAGFIEWHASQMLKAAAYLNPESFGHLTPRDAIGMVTRAPERFEHAGRRGTYCVKGYGDGFRNTLEAIKSFFNEHGRALHNRDVHSLLQRSIPLENVIASLGANQALFRRLGGGVFEYLEGVEVQVPERDWLIAQCSLGESHDLKELRTRARAVGLSEFRIHGLAATCPELELVSGRGKKSATVRARHKLTA
ncbi:MAG TPA: sigma factor-like helix-turn-helix DNA-binding protein [Myxococcaceae bacterium]